MPVGMVIVRAAVMSLVNSASSSTASGNPTPRSPETSDQFAATFQFPLASMFHRNTPAGAMRDSSGSMDARWVFIGETEETDLGRNLRALRAIRVPPRSNAKGRLDSMLNVPETPV